MPWPKGPGAQDETLFVTNPAVPASPSKPRCYDQSFLSFCRTVNSSGGSGSGRRLSTRVRDPAAA